MGSVIEFKRPEKEDPHGAGEAVCMQCGKEWVAVAPIGETQLECPECHTMKGHFKFPFAPSGDRWECNCSNQLFYLTPEGNMCANCGTYQQY